MAKPCAGRTRSGGAVREGTLEVTTRRAWLLLGTSALLSLVGCGRPPELGLAPGQWEFGELDGGAPAVQEITVSNPGRGTEVRFVSTCPCLTIEPSRLELGRGASARVGLRYDPSGDEGDVAMLVIVRSGGGRRSARQVLPVSGRVRVGAREPQRAGAQSPPEASSAGLPLLSFDYFYDPGCKGCEVFLVRQMVALQRDLGVRLQVARHDISQAGTRQEYLRRLSELRVEERAYPAVVFGDAVLQGDEQISREFAGVLRAALGREGP